VHSLFRLDDPLPVPPGQSPFHIRGIYYDRLIVRMKKRLGGVAATIDAIDDPRVREFASQRFSWMGWYDVLPAVLITRGFARTLNVAYEEGIVEQTKLGALDVVPSAFRPILSLPGPAALAAQAERITATMLDFVRLHIEESTETHTNGWGRGVPLFAAPLIASTVIGFFSAVLQMRGGTNVRGRYTHVVPDGERDGFELVSIRYDFSWSAHGTR
jgi:hypothetical protein